MEGCCSPLRNSILGTVYGGHVCRPVLPNLESKAVSIIDVIPDEHQEITFITMLN